MVSVVSVVSVVNVVSVVSVVLVVAVAGMGRRDERIGALEVVDVWNGFTSHAQAINEVCC